MQGRIAGDRLRTFESAVDEPVRIRLTWELAAVARIVWRNEMSVNGGPWSLVEQYDCVPSAITDERTSMTILSDDRATEHPAVRTRAPGAGACCPSRGWRS